MKAGLGFRLEGFFLVFGIEGDYRFARARATLILTKRENFCYPIRRTASAATSSGEPLLDSSGAARSNTPLSSASALTAE